MQTPATFFVNSMARLCCHGFLSPSRKSHLLDDMHPCTFSSVSQCIFSLFFPLFYSLFYFGIGVHVLQVCWPSLQDERDMNLLLLYSILEELPKGMSEVGAQEGAHLYRQAANMAGGDML